MSSDICLLHWKLCHALRFFFFYCIPDETLNHDLLTGLWDSSFPNSHRVCLQSLELHYTTCGKVISVMSVCNPLDNSLDSRRWKEGRKKKAQFCAHIKRRVLFFFLSWRYEVSLPQSRLWWHLLCFRGGLSDSLWRTWSTHHAGLIHLKFSRVCVTSHLSRDHVDVAIACCCFVLGH